MVPIWCVDAFARNPFSGNPAAVCHLNHPADPVWMQQVAGELNLSETAFIAPQDNGWSLRWFTPKAEVDLCGHATLASAHYLWESGNLSRQEPARFITRVSGDLVCWHRGGMIEMDFPSRTAVPCELIPGLEAALGTRSLWLGRSRDDYLVQVESAETVRHLQPDLIALARLPVRGVIVTAAGEPPFDMVSRFFAPAAGVPEDPVTGSAHCTLAPFWFERTGKHELRAWQASARGGELYLRFDGPRVFLGGHAVTIWQGTLRNPSSGDSTYPG